MSSMCLSLGSVKPAAFLVMESYKENEDNLLEMPQFKVRPLNGTKELWYYERDQSKIVREPADGN